MYAPEGRDGQAREGKGRWGRLRLGMRRGTKKEKGEKGADRGGSGRSPNARSSSCRWGRPHRSAAGRAEEEREARRQQAAQYQALADMEHQRSRHQPPEPGPDTIYRLEMGSGRAGSVRQGGQEGRERCTAANPVAGCGERTGRQDRAAQRRRGAAASRREGKRVGASNVDRQAARCRAGMRD